MEKARSLDYGQMGTGPQNRECRAKDTKSWSAECGP